MKGIEEPFNFDEVEQLPSFGPQFMAHASASEADLIAPLTRSDGVGAVIATRSETKIRTVVRTIREANPDASILFDAGRYSGRHRGVGAECMTTDWVTEQLRAGLPWALTDSGFIPAGDLHALRSVLRWPAGSSQVITALPLAGEWLTWHRATLLAELGNVRGPVAVMLESEGNPLASEAAVAGLIAVLQCPFPVLLLRSDTSALGALAHGAAAVSVGTRSGLRHIYPVTDDDSHPFTRPTSAYVPALMSYYRLVPKVEDGITRNPDLDVWRCDCSQCLGRSLSWILADPDPDAAALEHSLASQARVAEKIMSCPSMRRAAEWKRMCDLARSKHKQIVTRTNKRWQPAPALKAWASTPEPEGTSVP